MLFGLNKYISWKSRARFLFKMRRDWNYAHVPYNQALYFKNKQKFNLLVFNNGNKHFHIYIINLNLSNKYIQIGWI